MQTHLVHLPVTQFKQVGKALCWSTLFAFAAIGFAIAAPRTSTPVQVEPQPVSPLDECTCRANGANYRLGEKICLNTPNGQRVAICELTQNVTNWGLSTRGCDVSGLFSRKPVKIKI